MSILEPYSPSLFSPFDSKECLCNTTSRYQQLDESFLPSWRCQLPLDSRDYSVELTCTHTHLRSFTQSRLQLWNPLLLCCCLGSVYSSPACVYFRPLTLLQTWRRSISRGSAYRLVNGALAGSLLTLIIPVYSSFKSFSCPQKAVLEERGFRPKEFR